MTNVESIIKEELCDKKRCPRLDLAFHVSDVVDSTLRVNMRFWIAGTSDAKMGAARNEADKIRAVCETVMNRFSVESGIVNVSAQREHIDDLILIQPIQNVVNLISRRPVANEMRHDFEAGLSPYAAD